MKHRVSVRHGNTLFNFRGLDDMFEGMFGVFGGGMQRSNYTMTTTNDGKAVLISIDAPGVKKEDVNITTSEKSLRIEATRKGAQPETSEYNFDLTSDHDSTAVEATLADGVLEIKVPYRVNIEPQTKKVVVK